MFLSQITHSWQTLGWALGEGHGAAKLGLEFGLYLGVLGELEEMGWILNHPEGGCSGSLCVSEADHSSGALEESQALESDESDSASCKFCDLTVSLPASGPQYFSSGKMGKL